MNFHDNVHLLVKSFKETNEYKEYLVLKKEIEEDKDLYKMVKEFKDKQKSHQMNYINGGKIDQNDQKELQELYSKLIQKEKVKRLFEIEIRLDVLLADMQKIIAEGIKDILEF